MKRILDSWYRYRPSLAAAVVLAATGVVGSFDYADQLVIDAIEKEQRPQRVIENPPAAPRDVQDSDSNCRVVLSGGEWRYLSEYAAHCSRDFRNLI